MTRILQAIRNWLVARRAWRDLNRMYDGEKKVMFVVNEKEEWLS